MAKAKRKSKPNGDARPAAVTAERHVLTRRDCKLPRNITFRTQDHGDETVQAGDIRITKIELSEEECCALAQEKYFTRGLFVSGGRGKPDQPLLSKFEPLQLAERIESAKVVLFLGPNSGGECNLGTCKLKSVKIHLESGRKISLSCLVQSTPKLDHRIGELVSRMDGGAQVRIEYEHNAEQLEADVTADQGKRSADDGNEAAAQAQVEAFNRGTPVVDAPAETH